LNYILHTKHFDTNLRFNKISKPDLMWKINNKTSTRQAKIQI